MIIKQYQGLILLSLIGIFSNSFCMKREIIKSGLSEKKVTVGGSQCDAKERQTKRRKFAENEEQTDLISIGQTQKFERFDELSYELQKYILYHELQSIIKKNSPFEPLAGVKEFLDNLCLVSKNFKIIAEYLGWNNTLTDDNKEARYQIMVKDWFVPEDMRDQDEEALNIKLKALLFKPCTKMPIADTMDTEMTDTEMEQFKRESVDEQNNQVMAAKLLIAGASPDLTIPGHMISSQKDNVLLSMHLTAAKIFQNLLSLLILRNIKIYTVDDKGFTILMYAVRYPRILKEFLAYAYDKEGINMKQNEFGSALDQAVRIRCEESVELLLQHGAVQNNDLAIIISHPKSSWSTDDVTPEDLKILELLIKFDADIDQLPSDTNYRRIDREYLLKVKEMQDCKYDFMSEE